MQNWVLFLGIKKGICVEACGYKLLLLGLWLRTEAPSRRLSLARSGKEATIDRARACVVMNLLRNYRHPAGLRAKSLFTHQIKTSRSYSTI